MDSVRSRKPSTRMSCRVGGGIPPDNGEPTALGWRCPRCGSHNIDEQHTDGTGFGRHVDLQCEACGLVASFDAGAPDAAAWRG